MDGPKVITRKVIAEYDDVEGWYIMSGAGDVSWLPDAAAVSQMIRSADKALSKRENAIVTTLIDWRNIPTGFVPPRIA